MRKFWGELLLLLALFGIAISTEKASSTNMFQFPATPAATSTAQSCERGNDTGGLAISADGKFLLAIYSDSEARLWDFATGELLHHFLDPSHEFSTFVSFSPDNKYAVTSGVKGTILWDVQTGVKHHTFEGDLQDDRTIVSFSSDSEYLFTGGAEGIRMWSVQTGQLVSFFHGFLQTANGIFPSVSSDGKYALTMDDNTQTWQVWDTHSGAKLHTFKTSSDATTGFSPDSQSILINDYGLTLWNIATYQLIRTIDPEPDDRTWQFSPDGRYLLTRDLVGKVVLWDMHTNRRLHTFMLLDHPFPYLFLSDCNRLLLPAETPFSATEASHFEGQILIWDIQADRSTGGFLNTDLVPPSIAAPNPDQWIAVNAYDGLQLLDVQTGKEIRTYR